MRRWAARWSGGEEETRWSLS